MKNHFLLSLLLITCMQVFGQAVVISGKIKNEQGARIPIVFVRDAAHGYATFADSTGLFKLKADPSSELLLISPGYKDAKAAIDNKANIDVVMQTDAQASTVLNPALTAVYIQNAQQGPEQGTYSEKVRDGFIQEPTKGSPLLFNNWVHGFALGNNDELRYDMSYLYNYDKLTGEILFTRDGNTFSKADKSQLKCISLYSGKSQPYTFENAPAPISNKSYTEVLVSSPQYKIYKKIDTKLVRADYHNNGVTESGHKYDEYVDAVKYYFVKLPGQSQSFSLKKNAIKKMFDGKADKFIDLQGDRTIDDTYLKDLGYSLK